MSTIRFFVTTHTAEGTRAPLAAGAVLAIPSSLHVISGDPDELVPTTGAKKSLVAGYAEMDLPVPGVSWCWIIRVTDANNRVIHEGYFTFPESLTPLDYPQDLIEVDPSTLIPVVSAVPAWVGAVSTTAEHVSLSAASALVAQTESANAAASAAAAADSESNVEADAVSAASSADSAAQSAIASSASADGALASANASELSAASASTKASDASSSAVSASAAAESSLASEQAASLAKDGALAAKSSAETSASMAESAAEAAEAAKALTQATSIAVGTVDTTAPGTPATAAITGTAPDFTLDLSIPSGSPGPAGLPGPAQLSPDPVEPELYDIGEYDYVTSRWTVVPESFGAAGDGVTDDTLAIQAAIDYAETIRGAVRFTALEYLVSPLQTSELPAWPVPRISYHKCLNVKSGVTLDLGSSTIREVASAAMLANPEYPDVATAVLNLWRVHDVHIIGGTIVGDRVARNVPDNNTDGSNSGCVEIYHCSNVLIENTIAREGTGDGFSISDKSRYLNNLTTTEGSTLVSLGASTGVNWSMLAYLDSVVPGLALVSAGSAQFPDGSTVVSINNSAHTFVMSAPATMTTTAGYLRFDRVQPQRIVLDGCAGDHNRRNGLTIESGYNIKIRNCNWINTMGASPGAGIDVEPAVGPFYLRDVNIENCHTTGNAIAGIYVQTCEDVRVRDCYLVDGLTLRAARDVFVTGNRISYMSLKHSGAVITNNLFTSSGIVVYNGEGNGFSSALDVVIANNTFSLKVSTMIAIFNIPNIPSVFRDLYIVGNVIETNDDIGKKSIFITTASSNRVFARAFVLSNVIKAEFSTQLQTTAGAIFSSFPNTPVAVIKNNTIRITAPTAYAGIPVGKLLGGDVLIEGNSITVNSPNISSVLHAIDSGTYTLLRNTVLAGTTIPAFASRAAAGPTIRALQNVTIGVTAAAAVGVLAVDTNNSIL